jgi:hypothetical protein
MPSITIVTPSFRDDLDRCELLADGVARFASGDFRHIVIVPRRDLADFQGRLGRYGVAGVPEEELLPSWLLPVPFSHKWQLTPRGWPVRGWMRQQVIKIAYASLSTADAVVFADSDVCFVKPFDSSLVLSDDGRVRLLSEPGEGDTPMHHDWYRRGYRLLGLPVSDYSGHGFIGNIVPWVPEHVRSMVRRIEAVSGSDWRRKLLYQKTLSEYVLYGLFVEEVLGLQASRHFVSDKARPVHEYWNQDELSDDRLLAFVRTMNPEQLAIHIQSKATYSFDRYARAVRDMWAHSNTVRTRG